MGFQFRCCFVFYLLLFALNSNHFSWGAPSQFYDSIRNRAVNNLFFTSENQSLGWLDLAVPETSSLPLTNQLPLLSAKMVSSLALQYLDFTTHELDVTRRLNPVLRSTFEFRDSHDYDRNLCLIEYIQDKIRLDRNLRSGQIGFSEYKKLIIPRYFECDLKYWIGRFELGYDIPIKAYLNLKKFLTRFQRQLSLSQFRLFVLVSIMVTSKTEEDFHFQNKDYFEESKKLISQRFGVSLQGFNKLERIFVEKLDYDVMVSYKNYVETIIAFE